MDQISSNWCMLCLKSRRNSLAREVNCLISTRGCVSLGGGKGLTDIA